MMPKEYWQGVLEALLDLSPKPIERLYAHVSHRFQVFYAVQPVLEERFGQDNLLMTPAPGHSRQSFFTFDQAIEEEKTKELQEPVAQFFEKGGIDAVLYLCQDFCDGYQDPVFPDSVNNSYHIWHAIRTAQKHQKPLLIGHLSQTCLQTSCPEGEYVTNPDKLKVPYGALWIWRR